MRHRHFFKICLTGLGLALGSTSFLFLAPAFATEPTTGPLAGTTAAHNQVRQNLNNGVAPTAGALVQPVPCPPLPDFVWDDTVAATAQTWADMCTCAHQQAGNPYGENLSMGTVGAGVTGAAAAVSWADEVRAPGYDYANRDCPTGMPTFPNCGHYTAVAWSTTTQVGCGFAACGAATGCGALFGGQAAEYVVCRYNQPGNFPAGDGDTLRPYCTEAVTTDCQPGPGVCGGGGNPVLTVTKNGTGAGTVTSSPPGIDCGATCMSAFANGTPVSLTAAASPGSTFVTWGGACAAAGANPVCMVTVDAAKTATATFNTAVNPCATAVDLVCGNALNGTTVGAANDFNTTYSCTGDPQNGTDVVYRLESPESGMVTVDLNPNVADLDLFVLSACSANNCAVNSEQGGGVAEQVQFTATAGQTYYVVVEDYNSAGDTFALTATCPCTAPNGVNQNLTNDTVTNTQTVHVCSIITAGADYGVGTMGNLTLRAGHSVVFTNDFSVQSGGSLTVRTD